MMKYPRPTLPRSAAADLVVPLRSGSWPLDAAGWGIVSSYKRRRDRAGRNSSRTENETRNDRMCGTETSHALVTI
jgi:hypothetical protein